MESQSLNDHAITMSITITNIKKYIHKPINTLCVALINDPHSSSSMSSAICHLHTM